MFMTSVLNSAIANGLYVCERESVYTYIEYIRVSCAPYRVAVFELVTYSRIRVEGGRVPFPITAAHKADLNSDINIYIITFSLAQAQAERRCLARSVPLFPQSFSHHPHESCSSSKGPSLILSQVLPSPPRAQPESLFSPMQQRKHTWPPPQAGLNNEATGEGARYPRTSAAVLKLVFFF